MIGTVPDKTQVPIIIPTEKIIRIGIIMFLTNVIMVD